MKRVYLHVGKHKTGSTSIQKFLWYNRSAFLDAGFYPVTNDETRNVMGIGYEFANVMNNVSTSHIIIRDRLKTPLRFMLGDPFRDCNRRLLALKLNSFFKSIPFPSLIISAESFSFLRSEEEKSLYQDVFRDLHVIPLFFLRQRIDWMRSWKTMTSHLLVGGMEVGFESILDYSENSWLFDDRAIIDFFENTHILSYEMAIRNHASVIPAFVEAIGLRLEMFERIEFFENQSRR